MIRGVKFTLISKFSSLTSSSVTSQFIPGLDGDIVTQCYKACIGGHCNGGGQNGTIRVVVVGCCRVHIGGLPLEGAVGGLVKASGVQR